MEITEKEILNPSISDLPSKDLVIELCRKKGLNDDHLTYSTRSKDIFIKYNSVNMDEARAQLFFYDAITKKPDSTISIPEIYHAFQCDKGDTYILMEHIDIMTVASDEQRAQAISELISVAPPFWHLWDHEVPILFTSGMELEAYVNRALEWFNKLTKRQDKGDFSNDPLLCYYSDIYRDNFPVDTRGRLWVVDFQEAGVLPASFMNFALLGHPKHPLPLSIRNMIPLPKSNNLGAMGRASYVLKTTYNTFHIPPQNDAEPHSESHSAP